MKTQELKPCPFCGGTDLKIFVREAAYYRGETLVLQKTNQNIYKITCSCGASGGWEYEKETTIKKWNTRTSDVLSDEEIDRLLKDKQYLDSPQQYIIGYKSGFKDGYRHRTHSDVQKTHTPQEQDGEDNGKLEVKIWDWVVTKGGKIVQVIDDDMPELPYEQIKRLATPEEVKIVANENDYIPDRFKPNAPQEQVVDVLNEFTKIKAFLDDLDKDRSRINMILGFIEECCQDGISKLSNCYIIPKDGQLREALISEINKWSDKYEFSFQFWGKDMNTVYVMKDQVDLTSFGGCRTMDEVMIKALEWVYRINRTPKSKRITLSEQSLKDKEE